MPSDFPVVLSDDEKRFLMESALLLRDAKRFDEARTVFEGLLPFVADKHLPKIGLGTIHFERGEFDEAIERFEQAILHAPDSSLAHAHLGEALAFGRHAEEAELSLQKAIELDPQGGNGRNMARTVQKFLSFGLL